jgi:coenzyme F420-reducing hydrogenase beta subunit
MGDSLSELVSQFGESTVFAHARRSIVTALQSYIRGLIDKGTEKGYTYEKIVDEVNDGLKTWQPSKRKIAKTAKEKAEAILSRLSPGERLTVLREIESQLREAAE